MTFFKTRVLKIDPSSPDADLDDIVSEASALIGKDGIVSFPTDTVYGLGGCAFSERAVENIFKAKMRPPEKALSVLIGSAGDMESVAADIPESARILAEKFWPGALTIILRKKDVIPDSVTRGKDSVGLRVPAHPVALALLKKCGPLACPSANISGNRAPQTCDEVLEDLDGRIDLAIDGGKTPLGLSSTIIDLTGDVPVILRKGSISAEQIRSCIGDVREL
jgi:L-threonylcarbamoyladenylate synthase